ncbi:hypothetical protein RVBP17_0350 [Pseudomonas phage sp. 30-3]|nr:hypothetical protein RVBP17_0350 [Pseudomonas phage sp. 30-3]
MNYHTKLFTLVNAFSISHAMHCNICNAHLANITFLFYVKDAYCVDLHHVKLTTKKLFNKDEIYMFTNVNSLKICEIRCV